MIKAENINELLLQLYERHGTDLHLSVGCQPRIRVYGQLKQLDFAVVDDTNMKQLLTPLMDALAISQLNTKGQIDTSYSLRIAKGQNIRFRVNLFRQKGSWTGVFRLLNDKIPDFTSLGLPSSILNLYKKRRGLILVTGPTGSGKSTTLASFLHVINENTYKHIITLEDPIEYVHWHMRSVVNQREIGKDCDSFANGLRAALREDPDVILIGEMRDLETTEIALQSAETGHLVCSTLHTLGASETVNRMLSMFPQQSRDQALSQICAVLEAVVSQQLLPSKDGKGYVVAYEFLYKTREITNLIRENKVWELSNYLNSEQAVKDGMRSMDSTLVELYAKDKITKETALDYAFDRKGILPKLQKVKR